MVGKVFPESQNFMIAMKRSEGGRQINGADLGSTHSCFLNN